MVTSLEGFKRTREEVAERVRRHWSAAPLRVLIGMGSCGLAAGAQAVCQAMVEEMQRRGKPAVCSPTGCIGWCEQEVLVDVVRPGEPRVTYGRITVDRVPRLVEEVLIKGHHLEEWVVGRIGGQGGLPGAELYPGNNFFAPQNRQLLARCGFIDPESIEEYIATGGYEALVRALEGMDGDRIIEEVKQSRLRGRGGAGFPVGLKWDLTRKAPGGKKYVVCNADEGDPGAYIDRALLDGDPHAVIEGMIICAYAIGADEGYIYIREEYPVAVHRVRQAIVQANDMGLLGDNILGTGFNFRLKVKVGADAYVCGEETALLASIEGERGMPRTRPPYLTTHGLWARPTVLNNVESFANIPLIVKQGGGWYASLGTERSRGTKLFSLSGKVARPGLVELELGTPLRVLVEQVGGGVSNGRALKAIQIGGPMGGCLPASLLDTPLDYESMIQAGAMLGKGGVLLLDEGDCMVDVARYFTAFAVEESCGKCTPCREGTQRILEILEGICAGRGTPEDLEKLERLAPVMEGAALCGLGQAAPTPVKTALRFFRDEFEAHIRHNRCPAGVCQGLAG